MNSISPFSFDNQPVRTVVIDGEPWFVGRDVCEVLGYSNPNEAMNMHCKGVAKRYPLATTGGVQEARILSEPDVLRLIISSRQPAAERFERWVFEEVLPTIRRTGRYATPGTAPSPEALSAGLMEALKYTRWVLHFGHCVTSLTPLNSDDRIVRSADLAALIAEPGWLPLPHVPAVIAAAATRLAKVGYAGETTTPVARPSAPPAYVPVNLETRRVRRPAAPSKPNAQERRIAARLASWLKDYAPFTTFDVCQYLGVTYNRHNQMLIARVLKTMGYNAARTRDADGKTRRRWWHVGQGDDAQ